MAQLTAEQIREGLHQFNGSENLYRHSLRKSFCYTDGVHFLAEQAGAYWLIDAIASHQPQALRDNMLRQIQFWTLKRQEDESWLLFVERDAGDIAFKQDIPYSDFPLEEIRIWVQGNIMMLPNEY